MSSQQAIFQRRSGVLLHPTSLPGPYGIGELGSEALRFIDLLVQMGQTLWQVLPLGPTGYGDSPYQPFSSFAGNPLLISVEDLQARGLLSVQEMKPLTELPQSRIDFGRLIPVKMRLLQKAAARFRDRSGESTLTAYERFCEQHSDWLEDYALFMALKDEYGGASWNAWPSKVRDRNADVLRAMRDQHRVSVECWKVLQFFFDTQWQMVRAYAHQKGIQIIGDIPIFVSLDSADVWANRELFQLRQNGKPAYVAGVPPDYFSATGQLWGNPLYRWPVHRKTGYRWWIARMRRILECVDYVRIDHFRGFVAYWRIPGHHKTAMNGRWVQGPGRHFFDALQKALGCLPIVAEDLGVITKPVDQLRQALGLPGMKIIQFSFGNPKAVHLRPDHYEKNCVVYTGTHDNDTLKGWMEETAGDGRSTRSAEAIERERRFIRHYLNKPDIHAPWDFIELAMTAKAHTCILPLQDILELGADARMNTPSTGQGNWQWRFTYSDVRDDMVNRTRHLSEKTGRTHSASRPR